MGRAKGPAEFRPYRAKREVDGEKVEYGSYKWYNPFTKQVEILPDEDFDSAWKHTRTMLEMGGRGGTAGEQEATDGQTVATTQAPSFDGSNLLKMWAGPNESEKVVPPGSGPVVDKAQPPNPVAPTQPTPGAKVFSITPSTTPKKKPGMTPEQAAKLGRGMQKIVSKLNVAAIGGVVRVLGKDPYPLDDDELELLSMGWELFLDEFFIKNPPKPWMLILAGNVMCASVMYLRGETIVKEEDITVTEDAGGAPGHERFGNG